MDNSIVPALMFHSVGLEQHPWAWSYISEPIDTFEDKIAALRRHGFQGVTWNDLYDHMDGSRTLPDKSILLTFDDGYLDNWVYVYPILRKYEMKGTIFVNPDFVDPGDQIRLNMDDLRSDQCEPDSLSVAGFLNWPEMREMERSGLVDIQSHAMTHTWYFSGPRIEDFHRRQKVAPYPWLFWNANPERKPFYLAEDQQEFLPWGYPIFEHQKSLTVRRYFPEPAAVNELTDFVSEYGGEEFFERTDWRRVLEDYISDRFRNGLVPGRYETEAERETRIFDELHISKSLIEENLEKRVDFICWPGGANDDLVQNLARQAGYRAWTLDSRSQLDKRNRPGTDPECIKRIGTTNHVMVKGRNCGFGGATFQLLKVFAHQGSKTHSLALKAYKLGALIRSSVGVR